MPGASLTLGHVYVVRWDTITVDDFNALLAKLAAIRKETGKDVVYVAIQDDLYKSPDAATTEVMKQRFGEFADLIKADYIVMSAKGVKSSLQRSFLRAAIVGGSLVGVKGVDKVVVVSTLDEVFVKEAGNLPTSASGMMEALQKADALPRS
jgi:hypothetical protein